MTQYSNEETPVSFASPPRTTSAVLPGAPRKPLRVRVQQNNESVAQRVLDWNAEPPQQQQRLTPPEM